uniref:Uncharacterized protein n=1 Tax=Rhodnius prolixus TaxID=13249 RepID=T1H921_RHOPR
MRFKQFVLNIFLSAILFCGASQLINPPPVILVPGDGGSQLEAKLNKSDIVHYICQKTTADYFSLWLNIELLVPIVIDCWVDNIKLVYDNVTRKTYNQPGVDIRVPGFGESFRVEWLDPTKLSPGAYFKDIGNALVALGYQRDFNIRGAPFDFRKVHSMGGPMSVLFFQMMKESWKDKYIRSVVSLSGAFAGSIKALKVFVMGDDLGVFVLNQKVMKEMQITTPSLAWLMPSPVFWKPNEVLVQTEAKNYSLSNIKDFFYDINYMTGWEMRKDQEPYIKFDAPGVELHCLHGYGLQTVEKLYYKQGNFPENPYFQYGDGDGTVNRRSLASCLWWRDKQKKKIHYQAFPNMDHMQILRDDRIISYLVNLILELSRKSD